MKGVKRRFSNIRSLALFICLFMFISLFSSITVKADELENVGVSPNVSEQAQVVENDELVTETETELLIPEETNEGSLTAEENKEQEVITAENNGEEISNEEEVNNEEVVSDHQQQPAEEVVEDPESQPAEPMTVELLINNELINTEDNINVKEDEEILLSLNYKAEDDVKAGDTISLKIPSFIKVENLEYSTEALNEEVVTDDNTVSFSFKEALNEGEIYQGTINLNGKIAHTEETITENVEVLLKGESVIIASITTTPKTSTEPNPEPEEEVYYGAVVLTNVERNNNDKVLVGTKFLLFDENLKQIGDTYTTDEQGKITVNNLPEGNYYFIEIEPPTGYVLDAIPVKFTISKDNKETVSVIKENSLLPKLELPTGSNNSKSNTNTSKISKLTPSTSISKLGTTTSKKYSTLPNTGGNSKAVALVVALVVILVGVKFIRRDKDNNIS